MKHPLQDSADWTDVVSEFRSWKATNRHQLRLTGVSFANFDKNANPTMYIYHITSTVNSNLHYSWAVSKHELDRMAQPDIDRNHDLETFCEMEMARISAEFSHLLQVTLTRGEE